MAPVIWLSVTVASVVATLVIRFRGRQARAALAMLAVLRGAAVYGGRTAGAWRGGAGLGDVQLAAQPEVLPLDAPPGIQIIGRGDPGMTGRETVALGLLLPPPDHLPPAGDGAGIVLQQHPAPHVLPVDPGSAPPRPPAGQSGPPPAAARSPAPAATGTSPAGPAGRTRPRTPHPPATGPAGRGPGPPAAACPGTSPRSPPRSADPAPARGMRSAAVCWPSVRRLPDTPKHSRRLSLGTCPIRSPAP
jgi:hypothetical protein